MRRHLVTGSSSGIGAATCRLLAGPGSAFVVHARSNAEGAERVAAELRARGAQAVVAKGALAQPGPAAARRRGIIGKSTRF
ncbi:MAG: SDR family NAD(P)-dependent oxidoreductase, partial [Alphaproteobacteria bacterium]